MKRGLGFVGRMLLIGLMGIVGLLVVVGIVIALLRNEEGAAAQRFPGPDQIAAMAVLLDNASADEEALLLDAVNTQELAVNVEPGEPAAIEPRNVRPGLAMLLRRSREALSDRAIVVETDATDESLASDRPLARWRNVGSVRAAIALAGGRQLVVEQRGPSGRVLGVPTGFWLATVALVIAVVTVLALLRETRPLRRLTAAIENFSESARPVTVPPGGAPDMRALIETFNRMQERMSALVKGRSILAGAISHDLRTYLTRLRLRVDDIPDETERKAAEQDIDAMLETIDNSLDYARNAAGATTREPLDLAAVVAAEVEKYRGQGAAVNLDRVPNGALTINGSVASLRRVVTNLIDNALRYGHAATVSLEAGRDQIRLLVDDDGPGIPLEEREAIFEPFYRLDRSRNIAGGSGLGLALCRQIVEAYGGTIVAGEAPGGGARFTATLPRAATRR